MVTYKLNKIKFNLIGALHKYMFLMILKSIIEIIQTLKSDLKGPYPSFLKRRFLIKNALPQKDWCEAGSYYGGTTEYLTKNFKNSYIYSIELSKELSVYCKNRFANNNRVKILNGYSCDKLPEVLDFMKSGGNFFLDDHYSGGVTAGLGSNNSIKNELEIIFKYYKEIHNKKTNIDKEIEIMIFVDDIRYTMSKVENYQNYPSMMEIIKIINDHDASFYISFDMLVAYKKY
jgi:hypothetical protein